MLLTKNTKLGSELNVYLPAKVNLHTGVYSIFSGSVGGLKCASQRKFFEVGTLCLLLRPLAKHNALTSSFKFCGFPGPAEGLG